MLLQRILPDSNLPCKVFSLQDCQLSLYFPIIIYLVSREDWGIPTSCITLELRLFWWLFPFYPFTFNCIYVGLTETWNHLDILTTNAKEWIKVDVVVPMNNQTHHVICFGKTWQGKLVSQIAVDYFVTNFCHMTVSLSDCFLFLRFFVIEITFWSKFLSFQKMSSTFIIK